MEIDEKKPENGTQKEVKDKQTMVKFMVLDMAMEFAFLIAVPLLAFVYLGKWLDSKYHSKFFILIGLFVALAISTTAIGKRINEFRRKLK